MGKYKFSMPAPCWHLRKRSPERASFQKLLILSMPFATPPLRKSRFILDGGDWFLLIFVSLVLGGAFFAVPALLAKYGLLDIPRGGLRSTVASFGGAIGVLLAVGYTLWKKPQLIVTPGELRIRYPVRVWEAPRRFPFAEIEQVRAGEARHGYWVGIYTVRRPGQPDSFRYDFDIPVEELIAIAEELEAMGIEVVLIEVD